MDIHFSGADLHPSSWASTVWLMQYGPLLSAGDEEFEGRGAATHDVATSSRRPLTHDLDLCVCFTLISLEEDEN